jgi:hypothetical protein
MEMSSDDSTSVRVGTEKKRRSVDVHDHPLKRATLTTYSLALPALSLLGDAVVYV